MVHRYEKGFRGVSKHPWRGSILPLWLIDRIKPCTRPSSGLHLTRKLLSKISNIIHLTNLYFLLSTSEHLVRVTIVEPMITRGEGGYLDRNMESGQGLSFLAVDSASGNYTKEQMQ